jgi:endonuclease/exonuclease/phosphatase family metal-dependent hydrolase
MSTILLQYLKLTAIFTLKFFLKIFFIIPLKVNRIFLCQMRAVNLPVTLTQLDDLKLSLINYGYIGVGRIDGDKQGEFCPIFYKKDRFRVVNSATFWLSETPEIPGSKGWDAAYERIATWAIVDDILFKKRIFIINTHLDHVGEISRKESIKLLLDRINILHENLPIVLTGDFNVTPDSSPIKNISDISYSYHLIHTKDVAGIKKGADGTYHNFGLILWPKRPFIDYIFVSEAVGVLEHTVLPDKFDNVFISDHAAVIAYILMY